MGERIKQKARLIAIETPLGEDTLILRSFRGREAMSEMFSFHLDCVSDTEYTLDFKKILGQNVTVSLELPDASKHYFNGYIKRFVQLPDTGGLAHYQAEMVPDLWFFTLQSMNVAYTDKSVSDIIDEFCENFVHRHYQRPEVQLSRTYPKRDLCVQYRETRAAFLMRLLEQEGIYFYYKHERDKHTLVISDDLNHYGKLDPRKVVYQTTTQTGKVNDKDLIRSWERQQMVITDMYGLTDFNFKTPSDRMMGGDVVPRKDLGNPDMPTGRWDYPGKFDTKSEGGTYNHMRMEEEEVNHDGVNGNSGCRHFTSGHCFDLTNHVRSDQNGSYVLTSIMHSADSNLEDAIKSDYGNSFTCMPADRMFRPARNTPKPFVHGTQTAIVVGPKGKEIHVDEYGRVKIRFHWDKTSRAEDWDPNDDDHYDKNTCWVRVTTFWAGKQWGALHIPRIGQEVVVDFLEGDPDRPIIVGSVYNADNLPPYTLPEHATQSGIKSRSSQKGGADNFNELRFEDKKGEEEVYLHAERNLRVKVEKDRNASIDGNDTQNVGGDQTVTIQQSRSTQVEMSDTLQVNQGISVTSLTNVDVAAMGNITTTAAAVITLTAGGPTTITSAGPVTINAPMIILNTAMVQVAGVLTCATLIAQAGVVSPVYSPGLGNIL